MKKNLADHKPATITLSDGKAYELTSLDLNMTNEIEEKFDKALIEIVGKSMRSKIIRYILLVMLKPKYPELTEEIIGRLMTIKILNKSYEVIVSEMV